MLTCSILQIVFPSKDLLYENLINNIVIGQPSILMYPSGFGSLERCGVFFANGTTGDVSCNQRLPYVCYAPGSEPEQEPTKVSMEKIKEKTTEKTTAVTEPTEGSSEESPADRELDRQLDVILAHVLLPPLTLILSPDCGEQSIGKSVSGTKKDAFCFQKKNILASVTKRYGRIL